MRLTGSLLSRYFKRYIERELTHAYLRRQWKPISGWKEIVKKEWEYGEHRPWTDAFKRANQTMFPKNKIYVEPINEWWLFKGDRVELLVGKDKGKRGLINSIIKERNWVYVEGLNCKFEMQTATPGMPPICTKTEMPLLATTQVKLVDPADERPTDIEWRFTEQGDQIRVSVRSGRIIPMPSGYHELDDFVNPLVYAETDKDTKEADLLEVTFVPKLCAFEQDLMNLMGIKESRKRAKTYWY